MIPEIVTRDLVAALNDPARLEVTSEVFYKIARYADATPADQGCAGQEQDQGDQAEDDEQDQEALLVPR